MRYFSHTSEDIQNMLKVVGVNSLDELYAEVPEELKCKTDLQIPKAKSEPEIRQTIEHLAAQNKVLIPFAGGGAYDHYTPSVIPYLASRSEFLTSYTPYQPEISQGTLQYIFEYQSLMVELTGMEVSNASMYDGATATAEAMMMCVANAKKRNRVLISATFNPAVLRVVQTYAKYHGIDLVVVPAKDGVSDFRAIRQLLESDDVAGVIVPQPNYYGIVEDFTGFAETCHAHKALFVVNAIASTLGVLKTPGEWDADIACGDAQSLGLPLNFGGPYIGYLCTRKSLIRKMPGRLVGATVDADGNRCFVLTLQAREQHIRREKATSNICTAQGIMCLYVAAYLSLMGEKGLREVNQQSYDAAHQLQEELLQTGCFEEVYPGKPFLNEFALRYIGGDDIQTVRHAMGKHGYLAGILLEGASDEVLFAATEQRTPEEIADFVRLLTEITAKGKH